MISHPKLLRKIRTLILEVLFPARCISCGVSIGDCEALVCARCLDSIFIADALVCPVCRARLPFQSRHCHPKAGYRLAAATLYDGMLPELIWKLKYHRVTQLAATVSTVFHRYFQLLGFDFSGFEVVPIPLHRAKLRQRGFNQAEWLAGLIAAELQLSVSTPLVRVKATHSQTKLRSSKERLSNVQSAFRVEFPERVAGRRIILVDDVFTSGATMNEAVSVLKASGARQIIACTLSRT